MTSLDDLVFDLGVACPNYIKVDVDGIEDKILRGGERVLNDQRVRGLLVEIQYKGDAASSEIIEFLERCGFKMTAKSSWEGAYWDGSHSRNFIFARPD